MFLIIVTCVLGAVVLPWQRTAVTECTPHLHTIWSSWWWIGTGSCARSLSWRVSRPDHHLPFECIMIVGRSPLRYHQPGKVNYRFTHLPLFQMIIPVCLRRRGVTHNCTSSTATTVSVAFAWAREQTPAWTSWDKLFWLKRVFFGSIGLSHRMVWISDDFSTVEVLGLKCYWEVQRRLSSCLGLAIWHLHRSVEAPTERLSSSPTFILSASSTFISQNTVIL